MVWKKIFATGILGVIGLGLSGCANSAFFVSDQVRYSNINEVLQFIDYENIGLVENIEYDTNNGALLTTSWVLITYTNEDNTALEIYDRVSKMPGIKCEEKVRPKCSYQHVEIFLSGIDKESQKHDSASLRLSDSSNGEDIQDVK